MKAVLSLCVALLVGIAPAFAEGAVLRVENRSNSELSEEAHSHLSDLLHRVVRAGSPDAQKFVFSLEGYFVRPGSTPASLRQFGGVDAAHGTLSVERADGTLESVGSVKAMLRSEGFENLDPSKRRELLHQELARSISDLTASRTKG